MWACQEEEEEEVPENSAVSENQSVQVPFVKAINNSG